MCLNTVCQLVSRSIDRSIHRLIDKSIGQFGASKYFHVCICLKKTFLDLGIRQPKNEKKMKNGKWKKMKMKMKMRKK